jgi:NAD(P)-dependent dehydrogenase (short-subunit alcohol dehydrogenase family)
MSGKVALISGAASGLGAETARVFAEHGAIVLLGDIDGERGAIVAREITDAGGTAAYVTMDVRSTESVNTAVAVAEERHGRLDVLVANAGMLGSASFRRAETVSDDDWNELIDVNLTGAFRSFRAAIPALRRAGGGAMSATSSVSGVYASLYRTAYTASKGALNAIVRALAAELAPDNIRVNAVAPGTMQTRVAESLGRSWDEIDVPRPDHSPKARVGPRPGQNTTRDVANVHLFLCSALSGYVSGETIVADNAFSIWNGT